MRNCCNIGVLFWQVTIRFGFGGKGGSRFILAWYPVFGFRDGLTLSSRLISHENSRVGGDIFFYSLQVCIGRVCGVGTVFVFLSSFGDKIDMYGGGI